MKLVSGTINFVQLSSEKCFSTASALFYQFLFVDNGILALGAPIHQHADILIVVK